MVEVGGRDGGEQSSRGGGETQGGVRQPGSVEYYKARPVSVRVHVDGTEGG